MYFVILIWSSIKIFFHRVSACNSKNKLAVEVGEGFFSNIFLKTFNAYKCRNTSLGDVGTGGLYELSPFVTRLLWMYTDL